MGQILGKSDKKINYPNQKKRIVHIDFVSCNLLLLRIVITEDSCLSRAKLKEMRKTRSSGSDEVFGPELWFKKKSK